MKLRDIKSMDKNDMLALLGLETKPSVSGRLFGTLGTFGIGLLVGAGVALLLAPKSGRELREEIRGKIRRRNDEALDAGASNGSGVSEIIQPAV